LKNIRDKSRDIRQVSGGKPDERISDVTKPKDKKEQLDAAAADGLAENSASPETGPSLQYEKPRIIKDVDLTKAALTGII
jgi:hypothetical protein